MFNRYLYEKLQTDVAERRKSQQRDHVLKQKKKNKIQEEVTRYKAKVRNFIVELASNPVQMGQYQPPITIVSRTIEQGERLGAPQMFINGFKTNKQRVQKTQNDNKIKDYCPTLKSLKNQSFRQRNFDRQIQPQMKFSQNRSFSFRDPTKSQELTRTKISLNRNQSLKNIKLPSLLPNPQKKTYFKAVQQMGNSLKMMEQTKNQRTGLQNRLMIVMDGKQVHIQQTAMDLLAKCKLLKKKVATQKSLKSIQPTPRIKN